MSDVEGTAVLIVGGGPVGMGLAVELGQRGIACVVAERHTVPQPIPKGQNLTQRTMEHFQAWHAEDALRAARTIPKEYGIGGLTAYGTLLGDYHYDWLQRELVRPFYAADNERLPQYETERVLRARAAELPAVTTLFGWSLDTMAQDTDGVRATLTDRGGARRTVQAAYAVGCDGARSRTRELAGITETRADHDRVMVLLVFQSDALHRLLERYPGKSYYNVLHPDLDGYWMFFGRVDLRADGGNTWFFHAPVPAGTTADNYDFRAYLFRAVGAEFDVGIRHVGFWDLRFALADQYGAGRVFIAGDAAHSHPPYGGYGINTGLEDARNLGWKLAATLDGWGGTGLLPSYGAERRPVFASTMRDFIARGIETDRNFLRAFDPARDLAAFEAQWAARSSGAKGEVNAFEPNYEGSPIVDGPAPGGGPSAKGSHAFTARAGHHLAPQPSSQGGTSFGRLGTGLTLLAFGEGAAAVAFADAARVSGVPLHVEQDTRDGGREAYGAGLVLVRPDQFVAWAGEAGDLDAMNVLEVATGRMGSPPGPC